MTQQPDPARSRPVDGPERTGPGAGPVVDPVPSPVAAARGGEPWLARASVVVALHEHAGSPSAQGAAERLAAAVPWDELPAMVDAASREAAVRAAPEAGSVEVVLLLEATTSEQAQERAVAVVRAALAAAGLDVDVAEPSEVVVEDAYEAS